MGGRDLILGSMSFPDAVKLRVFVILEKRPIRIYLFVCSQNSSFGGYQNYSFWGKAKNCVLPTRFPNWGFRGAHSPGWLADWLLAHSLEISTHLFPAKSPHLGFETLLEALQLVLPS